MMLVSLVAGSVYLFNLSSFGDSAWAGVVFKPGNVSYLNANPNRVMLVGVECAPELTYIGLGAPVLLNQTVCNFSDYYFDAPSASPQRSIHFCELRDEFLLGEWRRACTFTINESTTYVFRSAPFSWVVLSRWQTCYNGSACIGQTMVPAGNFTLVCIDRRPFIYYIGNETTVFNGNLSGGHVYQRGKRIYEFIPSAGALNVRFSADRVQGILYDINERWLPGNRLYLQWQNRILIIKPTHAKNHLWFNASVKARHVYGCVHWIQGCISGWRPIPARIGDGWITINTTTYEAFLFTNTSIDTGTKPKTLAASVVYTDTGVIIKVYHAHFPVVGADVYINNSHYITDENGAIMAILAPGPYHVHIEKEGYLPLGFNIWVRARAAPTPVPKPSNGTAQPVVVNITLAFPSLNGDLLYISPPCNHTILITDEGVKEISQPMNIHFSTGPHRVLLISPCINITLFFRVLPRDMFLQMENQHRFYVIDSRTGEILNVSWYWYCSRAHGQSTGRSIVLSENNCTLIAEKEGYIPLTARIQTLRLNAAAPIKTEATRQPPVILSLLLPLFFVLLGPSVLKTQRQ